VDCDVVITGIGMVTPLGGDPAEVVARIRAGDRAATEAPFATAVFHCRHYAAIDGFDPERTFGDDKSLRLMNRDSQLAVVAARRAMHSAGLRDGRPYGGEQIALFGATGVTALPVDDVAALVRHAAAADGSLDLKRFGSVALKRVRPVLSFKILANMPICFVSITEQVRGANGVYTPWEGQGALAIAAGVRAIRRGDVPCALVGGCDVKTHPLSFIGLQQLGLFDSWRDHGCGCIPGEGSAFCVLEAAHAAAARGARVYGRIAGVASRSAPAGGLSATLADLVGCLHATKAHTLIAAADGDAERTAAERRALEAHRCRPDRIVEPKTHVGNLFAAAAAVQLAVAAQIAADGGAGRIVAHCFGPGSEQAGFVVEAA